jgi:hypothetical protein
MTTCLTGTKCNFTVMAAIFLHGTGRYTRWRPFPRYTRWQSFSSTVLAGIQDGGHFPPRCWWVYKMAAISQVYKMEAIFLHDAGRYTRWRPFSSTELTGIQDGGHFPPRFCQVYKMAAIFLHVLAGIQDGGHFSPRCWQVYKMATIFS